MNNEMIVIDRENEDQVKVDKYSPEKKLNVPSLDKLKKNYSRNRVVVSFEDPDGGEAIDFILQPISVVQLASIAGTIFGKTRAGAIEKLRLQGKWQDKVKDEQEEKIQNKLLEDTITEIFVEDFETSAELLLKRPQIIKAAVVEPRGLTLEIIEGLEEYMLEALFEVSMNGVTGEPTSVDDFPGQDA